MSGYKTITAVQATGTITIVDYTAMAGKTITIDGVVLTEGVDFNAETSNTVTAHNITTLQGSLTAIMLTHLDDVVTVKADTVGAVGNDITLATNAGEAVTLSGAKLTGGSDGIVSSSACVIYGIVGRSDAGVTYKLYDGTTASDTLVLQVNLAASVATPIDFEEGVVFKTGCFLGIVPADPQSDTLYSATLSYSKI